ncbi:MAG: Serine/threonine protein kinase, partial [Verrucomicrobia bacterium]
SPEQLAADKLDGRSDIYSLGLVAFNCLTGKLPFPSNSAQEAMIMRLTDFPKTLAEIKPDVEWPAELQLVMDRALARDADDRYQKAADFGREMAKAVEHMPASVAAGEGTMVMGAAGAAAVPATRVTGPKGGTRPIDAAASVPAATASAAKSAVPMIIGAVVVLAAVGGGIFVMKGSGAKALDAPAAAAPVNNQQVSNQSAGTPVGTPTGGTPTPGSVAKPELMSKTAAPGVKLPAATQGTAATGGGATVESEIARLEAIALDPKAESKAPAALSDVAKLLPSASGIDKGDLYMIQATLLGAVGKDAEACDAVKRAAAIGVSSRNKTAVKELTAACK